MDYDKKTSRRWGGIYSGDVILQAATPGHRGTILQVRVGIGVEISVAVLRFVFAYGLNTSKTRMRVIAESPYRVLKSVGAKGDFGHADGCV